MTSQYESLMRKKLANKGFVSKHEQQKKEGRMSGKNRDIVLLLRWYYARLRYNEEDPYE